MTVVIIRQNESNHRQLSRSAIVCSVLAYESKLRCVTQHLTFGVTSAQVYWSISLRWRRKRVYQTIYEWPYKAQTKKQVKAASHLTKEVTPNKPRSTLYNMPGRFSISDFLPVLSRLGVNSQQSDEICVDLDNKFSTDFKQMDSWKQFPLIYFQKQRACVATTLRIQTFSN